MTFSGIKHCWDTPTVTRDRLRHAVILTPSFGGRILRLVLISRLFSLLAAAPRLCASAVRFGCSSRLAELLLGSASDALAIADPPFPRNCIQCVRPKIVVESSKMAGFLAGIGVGYLLGLLIAPAPGAETRARIERRLDEKARNKARRIGEQAGEAAYEKLKGTVTG